MKIKAKKENCDHFFWGQLEHVPSVVGSKNFKESFQISLTTCLFQTKTQKSSLVAFSSPERASLSHEQGKSVATIWWCALDKHRFVTLTSKWSQKDKSA